jgi:hypothetical protein
MGSFGSIAGAETALTRDFGRHVFELAALLRVSRSLYNYRAVDGGRDRDRTCDPLDVNEVLSR